MKRFRKTSGYRFEGTLVADFKTTHGSRRLVLEHDDGWLFIFNPSQVEPVEDDPGVDTSGFAEEA